MWEDFMIFGTNTPTNTFCSILVWVIIGYVIVKNIIRAIKKHHKLKTTEIVTHYGEVFSKDIDVYRKNDRTIRTHYITFELDTKERISLKATVKEYAQVEIGDKGNITYQGDWYKEFIRENKKEEEKRPF